MESDCELLCDREALSEALTDEALIGARLVESESDRLSEREAWIEAWLKDSDCDLLCEREALTEAKTLCETAVLTEALLEE